MFRPRSLFAVLLVGLTGLAACASPMGHEDQIGSAGSDLTEAAVSLGDMGPNDLKTGTYTGGGAHSYNIVGLSDDVISADVTLIGGDAQAFITDANNVVLAQSSGSGPNTQVSFTTPAGGWKSLRIVFKDRSSPNGNFRVKLTTVAGVCNPGAGAEPWNHYLNLGNDCEGFHFSCNAPERVFHNTCGCGCEDPG
jgi:hypothetical protein